VKRLEKRAAAATTKLRGAQNDLREHLRAKGLRRVRGEGVTIVWSAVKGRPSFDDKGIREAAAKAGVELAQFETVGESSDRIEIRIAASRRSDSKCETKEKEKSE
jgi:hypothetical protein